MIAAQDTSNGKLHLCSVCGERRPLDQFRRCGRNNPQPRTECRQCANKYARKWRAKQRRKTLDKFASRVVCYDDKLTPSLTEKVLGEMIRRFGGLDQFVSAWSDHVEAARQSKFGNARAMRHMLAIVRMVEMISQPSQTDLSQVSDEDLKHELAQLMAEFS